MVVAPDKLAEFRAEVSLSEHTTIRLGGSAQYFITCRTIDEILSALSFFQTVGVPIYIIGGGSNVIFPDKGVRGLVLKVGLRGILANEDTDSVIITAAAGEQWDDLVEMCVARDFAGIECLSGIPGLVGATPIQNVGAYGQDVKETIVSLRAIDRKSLEIVEMTGEDCSFGYRTSRFKSQDKGRFVVIEVKYKLRKSGKPEMRYEELNDYVRSRGKEAGDSKNENEEVNLRTVREAVLALRRRKSMLIDPADPNSRSVGSFFVNPILSNEKLESFNDRLKHLHIKHAPTYKGDGGTKVSAAWLVENSGFAKGNRKGGVGISSNHALALVNYSGTTRELLSLANEIEDAVFVKFGIKLEKEAVVLE